MFKGITIFALINKTTMTRPEQPKPNHRFKTMQTLTTPSGNTFEYCLDSDEDCDVSSDIESAGDAMNDFFSYCDKLFK